MADETINDGPPPTEVGQTTVLPGDITESIALGGFCAVSGQPSSLSNLAYSNAIGNNNLTQQNTLANQQAMNEVAKAVLGNAVNLVANVSPMEAVAVVKMDTGNDIAQQLIDLQGAISGGQPGPGPSPHPQPVVPLPTVRRHPGGGIIVTARPRQFPLKFVVDDDSLSGYRVERERGMPLIRANSNYFPAYVELPPTVLNPLPMTISSVSRGKFPVQIDFGKASGPASVTENQHGTFIVVNKDMFPAEIRLIP